jgi:hypothetical protein
VETGENCIIGNFIVCNVQKYYSGDEMKENEIGEACGTHGSEEKCVQGFGEVQWRIVKTLET